MFKSCPLAVAAVLFAAVLIPAGNARAGAFGDVLIGLDYAGFDFQGQPNPLSGGFTSAVTRNFNNTLLDFGANELTLTGPVGVSFTTTNRGFRSLDFNITAGAPGNPLLYNYVSKAGGSQVNINGSSVFQAIGSIDQFGWYDFQFQLSSRQDAGSTGRFANSDGQNMDFDIGPVNVSGNIFADLLATVFDPLYESAGYENIFATFSGRTSRENALESTVSKLRAKMDAGINLTADEVSNLVTMATTSRLRGDDVPNLGFLNIAYAEADAQTRAPAQPRSIPEPATFGLLALSGWWLARRRRR